MQVYIIIRKAENDQIYKIYTDKERAIHTVNFLTRHSIRVFELAPKSIPTPARYEMVTIEVDESEEWEVW
jgi:hypothetical protein